MVDGEADRIQREKRRSWLVFKVESTRLPVPMSAPAQTGINVAADVTADISRPSLSARRGTT